MGRCQAGLSLPHCVPCCLGSFCRTRKGGREKGTRARFQLYPPAYPVSSYSLAHYTASSWDSEIAKSESPPMAQLPIPASHSDPRMPGDSWAPPASTQECSARTRTPSTPCVLPHLHVLAGVCTLLPVPAPRGAHARTAVPPSTSLLPFPEGQSQVPETWAGTFVYSTPPPLLARLPSQFLVLQGLT